MSRCHNAEPAAPFLPLPRPCDLLVFLLVAASLPRLLVSHALPARTTLEAAALTDGAAGHRLSPTTTAASGAANVVAINAKEMLPRGGLFAAVVAPVQRRQRRGSATGEATHQQQHPRLHSFAAAAPAGDDDAEEDGDDGEENDFLTALAPFAGLDLYGESVEGDFKYHPATTDNNNNNNNNRHQHQRHHGSNQKRMFALKAAAQKNKKTHEVLDAASAAAAAIDEGVDDEDDQEVNTGVGGGRPRARPGSDLSSAATDEEDEEDEEEDEAEEIVMPAPAPPTSSHHHHHHYAGDKTAEAVGVGAAGVGVFKAPASTANASQTSGGGAATNSGEELPMKFKTTGEYADPRPAAAGTGPLLDEFGVTGKLNAAENGITLPIFLTEPESRVFVVKNRPAVLKCKAAHALQLHFKCSGSSQPPPSTHDKHVDPHSGVHLEEVTATIHRDLVDEYFGKGPFKCECQARSSLGVYKSQAATVSIAYMRKQFATSPTSLRVEVGSRAELFCEPPSAYPEPKISWHKNNALIAAAGGAGGGPVGGGGGGMALSPSGLEHGPTITASGTLTFQQVTLQDMANYTCSAENIAGKRTSESAVLIVYVNGGWSPWSPWRDCKCVGKPSLGRKRTRTCANPQPLNGGAQCAGAQIQKSQDCISCPEDTQIVGTDGFDISTGIAMGNGNGNGNNNNNIKRTARWSSWGEWSACSVDCIQIRRRKCIANGASADDVLLVGGNFAGSGGGGGVVGSLVSIPGAAGGGLLDGGGGSTGGLPGGGGVPGLVGGGGKSACSGKDIQTAECRGELCHIGRDDFDWTLYLGLAFITAVFFAFGSALMCCARRGLGANPHYNAARTVMDSEYLPGSDKKEMHGMHIEAVKYDYANPGQRYLHSDHRGGVVGGGGVYTENHYDEPNLNANYTNPIDELSVDYRTDTPDTSTADTSNSTYDIAAKVSSTLCSVSRHTTADSLQHPGGTLRLYGGQLMLYIPELAIAKGVKAKHVSLTLLGDDSTRICGATIGSNTTTDGMLTCSTVVHCAPRSHCFNKPVILKLPHCLVEPELWHVNVLHADNEPDDLSVTWRKLVVVGEETINTPIFVQLEATHVFIMTEQLGRFVLLAEPKQTALDYGPPPAIKMKLIAFSQLTPPSSANCSLRIYVVKDFPNSKDICTAIEAQLGGSYLGESEAFAFRLHSGNLNIRVRLNEATNFVDGRTDGLLADSCAELGSWDGSHGGGPGSVSLAGSGGGGEVHEQVIPYNHILSSNNILHCEFSLKRNCATPAHVPPPPLALDVEFAQWSGDHLDGVQWHAFSVPSSLGSCRLSPDVTLDRQQQATAATTATATTTTATVVSLDRQGNYVSDAGALCSVQLPRLTKSQICIALDPPRSDLRDWRLLAHKLNSDRYIAYFATKSSPTEQILNLWETRASGSANTIVQLLMTLKEMEREDVMQIITSTIGPLWI